MNRSKVSIILTTYNRAHLIEETLNSVLNQTYRNWECIIIDDYSIDNTQEIIQKYLKLDDRFSYYLKTKDYKKGLPGSRNFGLDIAKGSFIIFFDDDDIVHPQNLEICVKELNNENIYFCRYIRQVFVNEFHYQFDYNTDYEKFEISIKDLEKLIDQRLPFNSCSVIWKKECFIKNRFVEKLMYAEDWELYSRILSQNFNGISINKTLFFGRKHENSNTGEFYNGKQLRIKSKKNAIKLIAENLSEKKLLNESIVKYLIGLAIGFRDIKLLNYILRISKASNLKILYFNFKNQVFPLWKLFKKIEKRI